MPAFSCLLSFFSLLLGSLKASSRMKIGYISFLASSAIAGPLQRRYLVKESHPVPEDFTRESDASPGHLIRLQLGLKQSQFEELERQLYETSDPDHHRYGSHLTAEEVNDLVKPTEDALAQVHEWLGEYVDVGSVKYSSAKDFISVTLPVSEVEKMLDTKYGVYRHTDGTSLVRAPEWKLPEHLHEHITTIQPTTSFLRTKPQAKTWVGVESEELDIPNYPAMDNATVDQVCNTSAVTPLCLRTLYGTVNYEPQALDKNQVGLSNYLGELNNRSDARIYLERYRPEAVAGADDFKQISVAGGSISQAPENDTELEGGTGIEGALDIETLLGISWPTPLLAWSTAGEPPFLPDADNPTVDSEPYLTWLNYILQQDNIPQVISNSYEDNEQTVPPAYAHAVCSKFAQLTARGVSIIFGSGDGGAGGVQPGGSCLSNRDNSTQFIPLFPSSCPYVTSVGGTVGFDPEVVAYDPRNKYSSGGGFSNYFPRPAFQASAVEAYLEKIGDQFSDLYNASGRAYPDIAAYSVNYTVIWNGTLIRVDGTSAATPTIAAILALVNDALLAAGKPVLGWLNPWLYKKGKAAFTDVTEGSSLGCNTTGLPAVEGWDAVTGFGTPVSHFHAHVSHHCRADVHVAIREALGSRGPGPVLVRRLPFLNVESCGVRRTLMAKKFVIPSNLPMTLSAPSLELRPITEL